MKVDDSQLEIRTATELDLQEILGLYKRAGLDGDDSLPLTEAKGLFEKFAMYPDYTLYVGSVAGTVVGTFALLIMENLAHNGTPSGILEDVAVAPEMQGRGIGKAMMRFAMDICSRNGCYKLVLSSNQKRINAHQFYESIGFKRHGFSFEVNP